MYRHPARAGAALAAALVLWAVLPVLAAEYHVAKSGSDANPGTRTEPLLTIQRAADLAQPGDTVTVHRGIYRERVDPPRGGLSNTRRIVYRAAPGEKVEIRGSEVVKGWTREGGGVWKATVPNALFGDYNPFADVIRGDWFDGRGRVHHTGAVYIDGEWLIEATAREELTMPEGERPAWLTPTSGVLLNVAWFRPVNQSQRTPATSYIDMRGVQNAPSEEGGDCVGWIDAGDWMRYRGVDFGQRAREAELRVASVTEGGTIELRLDSPTGPLLGKAEVYHTGGWQAWTSVTAAIKPTSGVRDLFLVFRSREPIEANAGLWFAEVGPSETTIRAQFGSKDPNRRTVEINVRPTVFFPSRTGRDYITVRGFALRHAATNWAPPTALQVGIIGPHWSKGWVIEDCAVSHSTCSGISLGKYGDRFDNTSANTAEGYVATIQRGLADGWNRDTVGGHVVRDNTISHCEQAGIVGSLGAAFCTVTGNTIHNVHVRRLFSGAEMAGIKFHGAIDTVIEGNHIHHTVLGVWLDWMAQGARVSRNLLHHNAGQDVFMEVDHGPYVIDNNVMLSPVSLLDVSQGGAYAHNLFGGRIIAVPDMGRETPYHPAHSTQVAGLARIAGGDNRFLNNVFVGAGSRPGTPSAEPSWEGAHGLWVYDAREHPLMTGGNVYWRCARPYVREQGALVQADHDPALRVEVPGSRVTLRLDVPAGFASAAATPVTTARLGRARVPNLPYESRDGSPLVFDTDVLGRRRDAARTVPGPFAALQPGKVTIRLR